MLSDEEWLDLGNRFANAKYSMFELYRQKEAALGITKARKYYTLSMFSSIADYLDSAVCNDRELSVDKIGDKRIIRVFYSQPDSVMGNPGDVVNEMVEAVYHYMPLFEQIRGLKLLGITKKLCNVLLKLTNKMEKLEIG